MKIVLSLKFLIITCAIALLAFTVAALPAFAETDHDEHDEMVSHAATGASDHDEHERVEKMQALIVLLQQLLVILSQTDMSDVDAHTDDHAEHAHDTDDSDDLAIWIEIHSFNTHVHVQEPDSALDTFFLDDLEYTEEDAIVTAIAERTGLSEHAIEEAITFPTGEVDEDGDSVAESDEHDDAHEEETEEDEHHTDEVDLDGIHIMADGTIMLGTGVALTDATLTNDGMIMLADGDTIEPEFDLR
ncbi:MAG: hypothetical protein ACI9VM_000502 [Candidatus Azotimanducaceae bacterium]|jgi:hypothetical protein